MVKKFLVILIASMAIGMIPSSTVFADGTTTVSSPIFGASTFNTTVSNSSTASLQGSATLNGKLEIKAQQPNMQHSLKQRRKEHKEHGLVCRTGIAIWGASETSNGTVWIPKPGNHGETHACLVHGIWRQILGPPSQWNCGNQIVWMHEQLPKQAVKFTGKFVIVTHFTYTVTVSVNAEAKQEASATVECKLAGVNASSSAHATGVAVANASATATGSSESYAATKAKSSAEAKILVSEKATILASAQANASVQLQGQATTYCSSQPVPVPPKTCTELGTCPKPPTCAELGTCTPPPSHWTEVSCVGFEELKGGDSYLVSCAVSDDNGAQISLSAYSNDANSRVSGINCYSNGGSPTCPSGGTFEFTVEGINNSSEVLSSSITIVASANGIPKEFISNPFPVDPYEGGF